MIKSRKIAVIGAGNVGATIAYTLTIDGTASEVVIVDINKEKSEGEAIDIYQCTALTHPVNIYSGDYSDIKDSDIVVLTVGRARQPGQTRTDLTRGNIEIMRAAMTEAVKYAPNSIYVVVSNPVDILTHLIIKEFHIPKRRVVGSGAVLDTARLNSIIASRANVSPNSIDSFVFAEHGETSFVPWSLSKISGIPISDFPSIDKASTANFDAASLQEMETEMRTSGARIIPLKGATYYAIATSVNFICKNIFDDTNAILSLSTLMEGEYGLDNVCLSVPCVVGNLGIVRTLTPKLTDEEAEKLKSSALALKAIIKEQNL